MIEMRTYGFGAAVTRLRHIGDRVVDAARKQMHRSADKIVELAKLQVPEQDGDLKETIRKEKSYGYRGRLQIDIVAGGISSLGRDTTRYAALVHEAYETAVAPNGPGPRTARKMAAYPHIKIGSGFLSRAAETERAKLDRLMVDAITKIDGVDE